MGKLNIVNQKFKGKFQQVRGGIEGALGQHMKGDLDKLRGKANEIGADMKMKFENSKN